MRRSIVRILLEAAALAAMLSLFVSPLLFVVFMAGKTAPEAASFAFAAPAHPQYWQNIASVISASDFMMVRAFMNSVVLTVASVAVMVLVSGMAGFVLERRKGRVAGVSNFLILIGLMIPPSVITTIWVLKGILLYRTLPGLVFVEVALGFPYTVILYRAFMATVPRELDEAAIMEGTSRLQLFFSIVFPLLKPVSATVIVLSSVNIFNDFVNPLYFLPGARNATIQLTLFNFLTRYSTQWNLLFADVLLVAIPPLLCFIFFNKRIVAGMTAGAIKT